MTTTTNSADWKKHLPYLETLSNVNNCCIFLIELHENNPHHVDFVYLSPNFHTLLGYDPDILKDPSLDPGFLIKQIHPEDQQEFIVNQAKLIQFLESIPDEECIKYKHIYEFRAKNGKQEYTRVISQHQVIELKEENKIGYILGIVDVSPSQTMNEGLKFRLVNSRTGEIIKFDRNELAIKLTKRELEILHLTYEGLLSKEISEKLNLSVHTVNGHRQNILQKLNVDNTQEAIIAAKKLRLIE